MPVFDSPDFIYFISEMIKTEQEEKVLNKKQKQEKELEFISQLLEGSFKLSFPIVQEKKTIEITDYQETFKDTAKGFHYQNTEWLKEETRNDITSVKFVLSRYEKYTKTIKFEVPVTVQFALKQAELYLSQRLTKRYYDQIKDDLFINVDTCKEEKKNNSKFDSDGFMKWKHVFKEYKTRGDCLSSLNGICGLEVKEGCLTFHYES